MTIISILLLLHLLKCTHASVVVRQFVQVTDGHVFVSEINGAGATPISSSASAKVSASQPSSSSTIISKSLSSWSNIGTTSETAATYTASISVVTSSSTVPNDSSSPSSAETDLAIGRSTTFKSKYSTSISSSSIANPAIGRLTPSHSQRSSSSVSSSTESLTTPNHTPLSSVPGNDSNIFVSTTAHHVASRSASFSSGGPSSLSSSSITNSETDRLTPSPSERSLRSISSSTASLTTPNYNPPSSSPGYDSSIFVSTTVHHAASRSASLKSGGSLSSSYRNQHNGGDQADVSSTSRRTDRLTAKIISSSRDSIQASPASSTSRPFPATTSSTASLHISGSHVSAFLVTSATRVRSISTESGAKLGIWPATVTYCMQSNNQPVLMVGFVTIGTNGISTVTNTSPSQSVVSDPTGSPCLGEVAISSAGTTTIIQLSTLPIASTLSQDAVAQIVTLSGTPVVYSPVTLSGYDNIDPIEISTGFVEIVNGHTTTQWGWWLIGPHGLIDPPVNRPWRTGPGNFGCIGGPLLCNAPCGDVDVGFGWFIHIVSGSCSPGSTGPPGWPGGPIIFGSGEPVDDPPPYPESPEDPGNEDPNECNEDEMECSTTTTMNTKSSVTSQISSSAASKTPYFLIAAENAVQTLIEKQLQGYDADDGASYDPDVGANSVSAGTWVDLNLTAEEAQQLENQNDIELIMTCGYLSLFPPEPTFSVFVGTTVSLTTLGTSPSDPVASKNRRDNKNIQGLSIASGDGPEASYQVALDLAKADKAGSRFDSSLRKHGLRARDDLQKRDAGTRLVRQQRPENKLSTETFYPQDLAMLAWAPGVPTVAGIDYIFEESKGENTWVYLVDSGVSAGHWEFHGNWPGTDRTNIDPNWLWAPKMQQVKDDWQFHGTCLASKICGRRSGVAKQATVIPVVVDETYQSLVTGLEQVLTDIPDRRRKYNQAIAGKTVLCISLSAEIEKRDESYQKMLKIALGGIMKQGVVIVVSAGNYAKFDGFVSIDYPAVLAASDFPLIKVGVVDQQGIVPDWGQEGDVYYCGVGILCAKKSTGGYLTDEEGSSGSVASFAGLIAYMMGKEDPPFDFGDSDVSQYPYIVKNYFTQGQGAFVRPGGSVRVAWNGLDGRVGTQCPLNLKKRQDGQDDDCQSSSTSSSIAPTQTPNSLEEVNLAIYYSVLEPCEGGQSECGLTYYVYVPGDRGLPIQECGGALGQGSDSVQFQLINLTGALENFIYTPSSSPAGTVTRDSLASPVTCSKSWSQAVAWKCISKKRMNVPDNPPIVPHYPVFYNWASCNVYAN